MLPKSAIYVKPGAEGVAEEINRLLPIRGLTSPTGVMTRWDGQKGTALELSAKCMQEVKEAAEEPAGGEWVKLSPQGDVQREYHVGRTEKGNGNRFFRFKYVMKVPPQLIIAALLEPSVLGALDNTVRYARPVVDFPDGRHRLMSMVAEAGPRPLFWDRDECALTGYVPPEVHGQGDAWYQVSCTLLKDHMPCVSGAIRNHTMYWGYKLEPFKDHATGNIHTKATLITQTEIFGWLPKMLVNQFIPHILANYMMHLEEYLLELTQRGAPARLLVESYGMSI